MPDGLHRCWRRMLQTKCVGDNYKMLGILLTWMMSPTSKFSQQHPLIVTNIKSSTSRYHQHHCHQSLCINLYTVMLLYFHSKFEWNNQKLKNQKSFHLTETENNPEILKYTLNYLLFISLLKCVSNTEINFALK